MKKKINSVKNIAALIGFPLIFVIIVLIIIFNYNQISGIFLEPENLKAWVSSWGIASPLVFIGLQIIQVIIFIIPGEIPQIAGGYLFGTFWGTLYSIIGILLGSAINFYLARFLGVPFIKRLFKEEQFNKMHNLAIKPRFQLILFIFFLIPGIPKDILTYIAGLSPMGFITFIIISGTGRLPGLIGSTIIGDAAAAKNWVLVIIISVIATILFFTGYFFKDKIYTWLKYRIYKKESIN